MAVKFLHTADWHLGRVFFQVSLLESAATTARNTSLQKSDPICFDGHEALVSELLAVTLKWIQRQASFKNATEMTALKASLSRPNTKRTLNPDQRQGRTGDEPY